MCRAIRRNLPLVAVALLLGSAAPTLASPPTTAAQQERQDRFDSAQWAIIQKAKALGATNLTAETAAGGGLVLGGALEGTQFAVTFPAKWKGGALLFAQGYSTPGTPVHVAENPIGLDGWMGGIMLAAYQDGLAAGHSAYGKSGTGVESATRNLLRLRNLLAKLGARRVYIGGGSMGGNVVMSLIEQHPRAFAGGLAACGVTNGWESLNGQLFDMRVTYNYLTQDTPYALPGEQDARRSALPTDPSPGDATAPEAYRLGQMVKIALPVLALFKAAATDPNGTEARIMRQVAAVGGFDPDPASLVYPLVTTALGADDLAATAGGAIYGNMDKVYALPDMSTAEAEAFNKRVQRVPADAGAVAYARRWHQATGHFRVPLITLQNRIDPLVPHSQSEALGRIVRAAHNEHRLVQFTVPGMKARLPVVGIEGYKHCGFTPEQGAAAWRALRSWVETGKRPAPDAVK